MKSFCARRFVKHRPALYRSIRALLLVAAVPINTIGAQFKQSTLATVPVMPVTRVEAGVKVYQHDKTAFARATPLELVGAPITTIGGAAADYDLTYAENVTLLSDGRISTLSPVGNKFYVFGSDGRLQRTLSRQGAGPGEIMSPSGNVRLANDTLFIADDANHRFSWFSPDKGYVRGQAMPTGRGSTWEHLVGMLPGNRIVMSSMGTGQNAISDKVTRPTAPVSVLLADGSVTKIADLPDLELVKMNTSRRGRKNSESHVIGFTRRALATVWDTNIVTGIGDGYRVDVRNPAGANISRIVVNVPRIAVTSDLREAFIEQTMQRYKTTRGEGTPTSTPADLEKIARDTPFADSLPPYNYFLTTPNGTLWIVEMQSVIGASWTATAFRQDGAIVGRLSVPSGGFPLAFGNDRVVVRTEDADGIVTLTVRRIGVASARAK